MGNRRLLLNIKVYVSLVQIFIVQVSMHVCSFLFILFHDHEDSIRTIVSSIEVGQKGQKSFMKTFFILYRSGTDVSRNIQSVVVFIITLSKQEYV